MEATLEAQRCKACEAGIPPLSNEKVDELLAQTLRKLQVRFEPKNNVHRFAAE